MSGSVSPLAQYRHGVYRYCTTLLSPLPFRFFVVFVRSVSVLEARLQLCGACVKLGFFAVSYQFPFLRKSVKKPLRDIIVQGRIP